MKKLNIKIDTEIFQRSSRQRKKQCFDGYICVPETIHLSKLCFRVSERFFVFR